jgi:hypothetical protein
MKPTPSRCGSSTSTRGTECSNSRLPENAATRSSLSGAHVKEGCPRGPRASTCKKRPSSKNAGGLVLESSHWEVSRASSSGAAGPSSA